MLGLPTKTVFDPEPIRDKLREKIERMAKQGGFCTLQQVAGELHLKQYEVNAILRYYDMDPFWREVPAGRKLHAVCRGRRHTAIFAVLLAQQKIVCPQGAGIRSVSEKIGESHSYAGITRIRFEGPRRQYVASQPACASAPWIVPTV